MHLKVRISSEQPIVLPIHHNHILQGFIYSLFELHLRNYLHQQGFEYNKRKFKLFAFSRLLGKYKIEKENFSFHPPVDLVISSPVETILQNLSKGLLRKKSLYLHTSPVFVESISVEQFLENSSEILVITLSPITVYTTLKKPDGTKKTYYYSPYEKEFSLLIKENLRKKYELVSGDKVDNINFEIQPYKVKPQDEKILIYKGTVIKGWTGVYKLIGDPRIIKLSYDTGLGAKNSQGFGLWEKFYIVYFTHSSNNKI